jgi:hypothetical protein
MRRQSRMASRHGKHLPVWLIPLLCALFIGGCVLWGTQRGLTQAALPTPLPSTQALPIYRADRPDAPAAAFSIPTTAPEEQTPPQQSQSPAKQDYAALTGPVGNTYGSLSNGGHALAEGEYIYFITPTGIYRDAGGQVRQITETGGSYLNHSSGWLYYLDEEGHIQKVTVDGNTGWQLSNQSASYLALAGNWLYYIEAEETSRLYRLRVDGTGNEQLTDYPVLEVCSYEGWLYCAGFSNLFRIRPDGTGTEELLDARCVYLQPQDQTLFAVRGDKQYGGTLIRIDLESMDITPLSEDTARCMVVAGDTVYYRNESKFGYVFSISVGGGNGREHIAKAVDGLCLAGDWFFYKQDGQPALCRMGIRGGNAEELP